MRVMIVDDEASSRMILRRLLERRGHEVAEHESPTAALAEYERQPFPLVVIDRNMPQMDGLDLCRRLRAHPEGAWTVVLMLTGESASAALEPALDAGVDDFISKREDVVHLGARLRIVEESARTRQQRREAEAALEQARNAELEIGATIQESLLTGHPPDMPRGLAVASLSMAARKIGGDFQAYQDFAQWQAIDVSVGDVMGKGIPAALVGAAAKERLTSAYGHLLGASASELPPPAAIVTYLHEQLTRDLIALGSFLTLFQFRVDLRRRRLTYVDCGHVPALLVRRGHGACIEVAGDSVPIGFLESETYREHTLQLEDEDVLVVYSDGVTELRSPDGEEYGLERLKRLVLEGAGGPPRELLERLREDVAAFAGGAGLSDDVTCVAVRVGRGAPGPVLARARVELPLDLAALDEARRRLSAFTAAHARLDQAAAVRLELAITEAFSNVVRHAHVPPADAQVILECRAHADRLEIELSDRGQPFSASAAHVRAGDVRRHEGGFGLQLIAQSVDEVVRSRDVEGWNHMVLVKYLPDEG